MSATSTSFHAALASAVSTFGAAVAPRLRPGAPGEPEDQLRGPFEDLMVGAGAALGLQVVTHGETLLAALATKPDYAIEVGGLLCGHVELKAPGTGVTVSSFSGHNRTQDRKTHV